LLARLMSAACCDMTLRVSGAYVFYLAHLIYHSNYILSITFLYYISYIPDQTTISL